MEVVKMNLSNLKTLQADRGWGSFHFLSKNQRGYDELRPLEMELHFHRMEITDDPETSAIDFTGDGNRLTIDCVVGIEYKPGEIVDALNIICDDGSRYMIAAV